MQKDDLAFLQAQSPQRLAEIYAELNYWKWPANSTEPESRHAANGTIPRRMAMLRWIVQEIGHDACNKASQDFSRRKESQCPL